MSNRLPTTKELDFILLAGCSCLLALLHHPIAEALASSQTELPTHNAATSSITAVEIGQVLKNDLYSLGLVSKTSRDIFREE